MRLVPITAEDEELTVRLECDPEMMRYIGMENQGEFDNGGVAGIMRCNDWRIDLRPASEP